MFCVKVILLCMYICVCESAHDKNWLKKFVREGLDLVTQNVLAEQANRMWHAYTFDSGISNREELVVKSIESDNEFNIGQEITEWRTINVRNKSYAVGLMSTGFTVLTAVLNREKSGFTTSAKLITLNESPSAFTMFKIWNSNDRKYDIILIAAMVGENFDMHWYRIGDDNNLEKIWSWHLHKRVSHLKVFEAGDYSKLLIISEGKSDSEVTADIYNFILDSNVSDFWLFQTIPLNCPATSSAINNFASDIYLSIPQNISNVVRIFHYLENRFVPYKNITSERVNAIADFKIGYKSFLAVGGLNFAIYRFTRIGLERREVENRYFEDVTYFLPIPVKTYRDEVMLLVQQHIDYSTHIAPFVKVVLYSKGSFYAHDEIPCMVFGQFSHGAICMSDPEDTSGISGAAVLALDKMLGVIVPKFESDAGLFMIDWSLVKKTNPVIEKVDRMMKTRISIEKMLQEQRQDIVAIKEKLTKSLKVDEDNEITAPWKINTIVASDAIIQDSKQLYRDVNTKLTMDFEAEIVEISGEIETINAKIISTRSAEKPTMNYEFEDLTILGSLQVKGTSLVDNLKLSTINDQNFDDLVKDCARRNQRNIFTGRKTFKNAKVENITFATINDIDAEKVAYKSGDAFRVKGDLTFKNSLRVTGNVELFEGGTFNDMILKDELVYMDSDITYENLQFEDLHTELVSGVKYINKEEIHFSMVYENADETTAGTLVLDSLDLSHINVTTQFINGQHFDTFKNNMCMKDSDYYFPGNTTIIGRVHVRGAADIKTLNGLKYPEEYLIAKESGFTRITGKKIFTGNVSAVEVVANGLVDGIDPKTIITCSVNQTIPGNFTFSSLEISESLSVNGSIIIGENNEKFIPNPTLEDTHNLNADVIFSHIEVDGIVTVLNKIGNRTIKQIFENVVYKDEERVTINATKQFTKPIRVKHNLEIESNFINNIDINNFITLDTEQVLDANTITGNITIDNLDVDGLVNGENYTELFNDFIRLDADEDIDAEIVFENNDDVPDIFASELYINNINGLSSEDLVWTTGDRVFEENVQFDNVIADHAEILKDLEYEIECFDINEYDENRLSLTRDQTITGKYKIESGNVDKIETAKINDYEWEFIKDFLNIDELLHKKLISGQLRIGELHVKNSLNIESLNEYNLEELFQNVFWTDRSNNISTEVVFQDDVTIKHLNIKNLNGENFKDFLADFVLKNETDVIFDSYKTFFNGFKVKSLNVDRLNDVIVDEILLKSEEQNIFGNVFIHGDVWVHGDLDVKNYINNVSIEFLKEHYKFEDDSCILKGNITFTDSVTIDHLNVKGNMNGIKPKDFFENIVSIYDDAVINGTTIFKKKVHIKKNMGVAEKINGVNLYEFADNVVLITSDDYIEGLVTFTQDVFVTDTVILETDLDVTTVSGCDLQKWNQDAIHLSSGQIKEKLKFEKLLAPNGMTVDYLNGIDIKSVITLNTEQIINDTLEFNFVTTDNDIEVGGLVNGHNLEKEYANTVLKDTDEEINVETIFTGPVTISKHMKTAGLVNGKDLHRVVTTDSEQNLTANYVFAGKITVDKDMYVRGLVNDIDIADWQRRVVTVNGDVEQNITDSWTIDGNLTFKTDVGGRGLLGGINIHKMAEEVASKQQEKYAMEDKIRNDYKNVCINVQDLLKLAKSQIYLFKYMEHHQKINLDNKIGAIHDFQYEDRHFLIVSQVQSCYSKLYEWISNSFEEVANFRTGEVDQFVTVLDSDRVYLVTKNKQSTQCYTVGINLWIFAEKSLVHIYGLDHAVLLQKSKIPGTFYTLNSDAVTEYKLFYEEEETIVHPYRKWNIPNSNYTFNAHDHKLGLSLRNAGTIVKLSRRETTGTEPDYTTSTITGTVSVDTNRYLPPPHQGEIVFMEVGVPGNSFKLTAVTVHEETRVQGKSDAIIIYEDLKKGKIYDKIPAFRPSNLIVLDFGLTGETLLLFLENKKTLQIYEFKGILGFKLRSSIKFHVSQMTAVSLPLAPYQSKRKFLLLINKNTLTVIQAVMDGDRPEEKFYCDM